MQFKSCSERLNQVYLYRRTQIRAKCQPLINVDHANLNTEQSPEPTECFSREMKIFLVRNSVCLQVFLSALSFDTSSSRNKNMPTGGQVHQHLEQVLRLLLYNSCPFYIVLGDQLNTSTSPKSFRELLIFIWAIGGPWDSF